PQGLPVAERSGQTFRPSEAWEHASADRRAFYQRRASMRPAESSRFYQTLLRERYAFLVPPDSSVVELGAGLGDLLPAVKHARGVGIDFRSNMVELASARHPQLEFIEADAVTCSLREQFDYIILSDLINDLPDVQAVFTHLHTLAHSRSRLVLNFFNNLWRPVLAAGQSLGLKSPTLLQNWLSVAYLKNLLPPPPSQHIKSQPPPLSPLLASLLDRFLASLRASCWLTIFIVGRPKPQLVAPSPFRCSVVIPARNEAGNIEAAVRRTPEMGLGTEIIFVEGHSTDETWQE